MFAETGTKRKEPSSRAHRVAPRFRTRGKSRPRAGPSRERRVLRSMHTLRQIPFFSPLPPLSSPQLHDRGSMTIVHVRGKTHDVTRAPRVRPARTMTRTSRHQRSLAAGCTCACVCVCVCVSAVRN